MAPRAGTGEAITTLLGAISHSSPSVNVKRNSATVVPAQVVTELSGEAEAISDVDGESLHHCVIKSDGSREAFDEVRLRAGMMKALEKRPVSAEQIEDAISHIKRQLVAIDTREISSREIGALVMHELRRVDHVAYLRFASVYLSFEDIEAFEEAIQTLAGEPTPEMHRRQVPLIDEEG